jgi:succinate dehydrogenase/fumarate reductase flavoprotein subunit
MARCALFREESRGAHFRTDFPDRDDLRYRGHTLLEAGGPRLADVEAPLLLGARC